jgi:hypothetical protein
MNHVDSIFDYRALLAAPVLREKPPYKATIEVTQFIFSGSLAYGGPASYNKARRTVFTDSAFWKTRATSGSNKTATDPGRTRLANRFALTFV